jgi:hypothetical protein
MPFNYLGTMREAQWKGFRDWILRERTAVDSRLRVIDAELRRLGAITVFYEETEEEVRDPSGSVRTLQTVSERRVAYAVSEGSTLEKLTQAYIAAGGNPLSISLYLEPDNVALTSDIEDPDNEEYDPNEEFTDIGSPSNPFDQPYGGVVATKSADSYGPGGRYQGALPTFIRDVTTNAGKYMNESEVGATIAINMDHAQRWACQSMRELEHLEQRIMKLMDLREQLKHERDVVVQQAIGGTIQYFSEPPDPERFARNLHLTRIVAELDSVFYTTKTNGEPNFDEIRLGTPEEPDGIATFDTLLANPRGSDLYATG